MPKDGHLRILALVTDAFGEFGGIAQYNRDLLSALSKSCLVRETVVLPRRTSTDPGELPARINQLPSPTGKLKYMASAFSTANKYAPFDIVFCGHIYMAPLAATIARLSSVPLWIQVHGLEAWDELSPPYRRAAEHAALITSVSRYTRRRLLEWLDFDPQRVKILANTVDARFTPGPKAEYLLRRHSALGKKVLLTVSRLPRSDRYKGVDRVIRAMPAVLEQIPDLLYIVGGEGDDRPWLERLAVDCGVSAHVRFVGQISWAELPDYFRLADVFVMPSTGEGFGIVFTEAVASGIDAIGGNKDGSADALGDGTVGQAIDPTNPEELVSAICNALCHPVRDCMRVDRYRFDRFFRHLEDLIDTFFYSTRAQSATIQ